MRGLDSDVVQRLAEQQPESCPGDYRRNAQDYHSRWISVLQLEQRPRGSTAPILGAVEAARLKRIVSLLGSTKG